jgi:hypothetical protein
MRTYYLPLVILVTAATATAQDNPFFDRTPTVSEFLELSETQAAAITENNARYNESTSRRIARIMQVQVEIAEETAREPLDPAALGIRYAEVEARCREIKDDAVRSRQANRAVLTEVQRERLKALEEAVKLYPVVTGAAYSNLLPQEYAQQVFTSPSLATTSGLNLLGLGGVPGCRPYLPIGAFLVSVISDQSPARRPAS